MRSFEEMFKADSAGRANFLARLFGLFNEKVVHHWCKCEQAEFDCLGRPTLKRSGERRGHTFDFALRAKHGSDTGKIFVAEMKCWLAYGNGEHLRLKNMDFAAKYAKQNEASQTFLDYAKDPNAFHVSVEGESKKSDGAILIWSAVTPELSTVVEQVGLARVLSIEDMLNQLDEWNCNSWRECVDQYQGWSNELFDYLNDGKK